MSRKGNYWDNAVAESFFHSLKAELTHHHNDVTKDDARQAIFDYIEVFYNRQRLHSANDYLSPVGYEEVKQSVKKGVRDSVDTSRLLAPKIRRFEPCPIKRPVKDE
jgi:transposase InsO family protein